MNDNNNQSGRSKVFGIIMSILFAVVTSLLVFLILRTM